VLTGVHIKSPASPACLGVVYAYSLALNMLMATSLGFEKAVKLHAC
jgi:hypothetical protein